MLYLLPGLNRLFNQEWTHSKIVVDAQQIHHSGPLCCAYLTLMEKLGYPPQKVDIDDDFITDTRKLMTMQLSRFRVISPYIH